MLREVRDGILEQLKSRFAHRGILHHLGWLDVNSWPLGSALDQFAVADLCAIVDHWKTRLDGLGVTREKLLRELDNIKAVWKVHQKPIPDALKFWRDIILQPKVFPDMHIVLRMCLAPTPSDAVVESAFSRLRLILADQRLRLGADVVEQLLILALDSARWEVYNYAPVLDMLRKNQCRIHFRGKRADKGIKRSAKGGAISAPVPGLDAAQEKRSLESSSEDSSSSSSDEDVQ
jgi:hypothetical protein